MLQRTLLGVWFGALAACSSSNPAADSSVGKDAVVADVAADGVIPKDSAVRDAAVGDAAGDTVAGDTAVEDTGSDSATLDGKPVADLPTPTCQLGSSALSQGYHTRNITHEFARLYTVYLPAGYQSQVATPVVLALHGGYGSADGMKDYSQLNATADKHGFIVAYPQGQNKAWNAGDCCGAPQKQGTDDVGFIRAVIDDLATVACVDPRRVYATGMSNGSMMSHRLACELSDRIAAIAGIAGQLGASYLPTCSPPREVSIMHIHGTDDRCAPYDGGVTAGGCVVGPLLSPRVCDASDPPVTDPTNPPPNIFCLGHKPSIPSLLHSHPPVADTIDHWIAHNGCNAGAASTQVIGAVNVTTYFCADNTELKFYKVGGGGHSWPGGPDSACCEVNRAANTDIDANEEIWKFFSTRQLP